MTDLMGDVATFVTLRAAGSALREMLSPIRQPGTPSRAGSPGSREGSIDLTPYTETSAVPSGEEPNDRLGATSPPRKMDIAMMEQRSHGDPGDRGGMGAPAGHRFCADSVVGYCRKRTPGRPPGSSGIPPAGHASAWPWGHRDVGDEAWRLYPSATRYTRQSPPPLPR